LSAETVLPAFSGGTLTMIRAAMTSALRPSRLKATVPDAARAAWHGGAAGVVRRSSRHRLSVWPMRIPRRDCPVADIIQLEQRFDGSWLTGIGSTVAAAAGWSLHIWPVRL